MPYALQPPLVDGQKNPGGMPVRNRSEVPAGWVYAEVPNDAQWPPDWRYDAANQTVRPPTNAERLVDVKAAKKAEGANRMHRENRAVYSEVQEVDGAWVAEAMIDLITEPRGARVAAIKANRDKRARFYALVDAAPSVEAVLALAWEGA